MSVFNEFFLLFETKGTEKVKKDQDKISQSSKGLNQNLKKTDFTTNQLSDSFYNLGKKLALSVAGIAGVSTVVAGLKNSIDYAGSLEKNSRFLDANVSKLDAWGGAVSRYGGTADGFASSLDNLSKKLYVSSDDALKLLPRLADSLSKMSRVKRSSIWY